MPLDTLPFNILAAAAAIAVCIGALGSLVSVVVLSFGDDGLSLSPGELRIAAVLAAFASLALFVIGGFAGIAAVFA